MVPLLDLGVMAFGKQGTFRAQNRALLGKVHRLQGGLSQLRDLEVTRNPSRNEDRNNCVGVECKYRSAEESARQSSGELGSSAEVDADPSPWADGTTAASDDNPHLTTTDATADDGETAHGPTYTSASHDHGKLGMTPKRTMLEDAVGAHVNK
jgi:hypothetical protein